MTTLNPTSGGGQPPKRPFGNNKDDKYKNDYIAPPLKKKAKKTDTELSQSGLTTQESDQWTEIKEVKTMLNPKTPPRRIIRQETNEEISPLPAMSTPSRNFPPHYDDHTSPITQSLQTQQPVPPLGLQTPESAQWSEVQNFIAPNNPNPLPTLDERNDESNAAPDSDKLNLKPKAKPKKPE